MDSDVLVIGGGIIGLSIARELRKRGVKRITLLEKGVCGGESSWAAAGMLGVQAEADGTGPFLDLCRMSRDMYPQFAADLLGETGIDIELSREGTLYLAFSETEIGELRERLEWQRKAGFPVEYLSATEAADRGPHISADVLAALYFPGDWQVDNRKLCTALKLFCENSGVGIIENTDVGSLTVDGGRVTGAEAGRRRFDAENVVLATGAWASLIKLGPAAMPLDIQPVRGQIIAYNNPERIFRHVIYSRRGYLVPRKDGRILAGSTSEYVGFDRSVTGTAATLLKEMANEISPVTAGWDIADQWAGLRPRSIDGMPILGQINGLEGLVLACGHYRNGILLAPATAALIADQLIDGTDSEYFDLFCPDRFQPHGVGANS